ncbi:MAG: DNA gyrase subunit A [Candidatus Babeliales bacterium]
MDANRERKGSYQPILIEEELKTSFLDYAMSVIVSRAIPDIRDGLKPVHRRILYAMGQQGFYHNKPYHKSVRIVGDVLGKYHPHGDQAVYQTMVGMVQEFSRRYPLLDGQGNWGSIDGDSAAAMRYTEVRMKRIAEEILADLDKNTVHFVPNFDESTVEPTVLPSRLPNLLVNGATGIAVGMATSIPPHNLTEVIDAVVALLKNGNITEEELFLLIPAPDFPTGGIICGRAGIVKAYKTGRGNLILRGVVETEETKKGSVLLITELPYQVNKAELIIKIANLVKNKVIEGISNIRDESNKKGMRVVIELKRGEIPDVVLNQLYKYTSLQTSVSILMLGLLDNKPMVFSLRQLLQEFIHHRQEVVYKRTEFDLTKAQDREHLLAGFIIALDNIDEVIIIIKKSDSAHDAITALNKRFLLTAEQGKAILEMRLQRLTGMEQEKIHVEMQELKKHILFLQSILADAAILHGEVYKELLAIKEQYGDERRTRIEGAIDVLTEADLIPEENVVVTLTRKGYIKRIPVEVYGVQHRGGKGKMGMASLEDDVMQDVFVAGSHDELLFFTNTGRVYNLKVFEVPEGSRIAKGRAVINLLPLQENEQIVRLLPAHELEGKSLVMLTRQGLIKRVDAMAFSKIRQTGILAIGLNEGDQLAFCGLSSGSDTIIIASAKGQGIRFKEDEVRQMGRQAAGVIGIRLKKSDYVVGMEMIPTESEANKSLLFVTKNGYGKRVDINDFRVSHRSGYGVRTIPADARNGEVIGVCIVTEESNILLIDTVGKIIRLSPKEIRTMGRQAKGVRLIRLDQDQRLSSVVAFEEMESDDEGSSDHGSDGGSDDDLSISAATRDTADQQAVGVKMVDEDALLDGAFDDSAIDESQDLLELDDEVMMSEEEL